MSMSRASRPASARPAGQQVFKPRASVDAFRRVFPALYVGFGLVLGLGILAAVLWGLWLVPVMMAFPIVSVIAGGIYTGRIAESRVVIDGERLRLLRGKLVQANLPWKRITRLTFRQERGDTLYELWVGTRATPLPAGFYEDGDKLLQAVSARSGKAWEAL